MTSAPVLLVVLEGENAVEKIERLWEQLTQLKLLKEQSESFMQKVLRQMLFMGSDSLTSAEREVNYFFDKNEVVGRF